uniref:Fungal lipase-type domain-containing protein n=1 Tax=Meloidogyne enterolobii TaxID=390850 RepID=A0A6V7WIJ3_MELEN|nr:unnamed protein product [Meloidogyne enterolobii]
MVLSEFKVLLPFNNPNILTYFYILLQLLFFPLNTSAARYRRQYPQNIQNPEVYSTFTFDQNAQQPSPTTQQRPQFTAYNEAYAKRLLALAAGAYSYTPPNGCERRWMPDTRLWSSVNQTCDALESTCSSYTVVSDQRCELIIVFRGTKTKEQLFLEGWQSLQPGVDFDGIGMVNKYFLRAFNTLWPSVKEALEDPRHAGYKVTFTGHSLGGALASLASARTVKAEIRRSDQVQLYTFGQPRVGNADFAFAHDKLVPTSFRVVHRMDIVPHMPACDKTDNWPGVRPNDDSKPCDRHGKGKAYHHKTEIWYPYGMKVGDPFYECLGEPKNEDFTCSDSLSFEVSKYKTYISDHRHYFDHKVPRFGKLGCDPAKKALEEVEKLETNGVEATKKSSGFFSNLIGKVKSLGKLMRIL